MVWSRDSGRLYFTSWAEKESQILVRRVDSAFPAEPVISSPERYGVRSLSADGRTLADDHWIGHTEGGLGFLRDRQPPWKCSSRLRHFSRRQFSPDGKWFLYQLNESGVSEIYVPEFPGLTIRRLISASGGTEPRWGRDRKEICFGAGLERVSRNRAK